MTRQCTQCGIEVTVWEKAHMCPAVTRPPTWAPTVRVRLRRNTVRFRVWLSGRSPHIGPIVGDGVSRSAVAAHPTTVSEKHAHNTTMSLMVAYGATCEGTDAPVAHERTSDPLVTIARTATHQGAQGAAKAQKGGYGRALWLANHLGTQGEEPADIARRVMQSRYHDYRYGPVVLSAAGTHLWGGGARVPYSGRARLQRETGLTSPYMSYFNAQRAKENDKHIQSGEPWLCLPLEPTGRELRNEVGGGPLRSPEVSGRPTLRDKVRKRERVDHAIAQYERFCDRRSHEPTEEYKDLQVLRGIIRNYIVSKGKRRSQYRSQGRRMCRNMGLMWAEVLHRFTQTDK